MKELIKEILDIVECNLIGKIDKDAITSDLKDLLNKERKDEPNEEKRAKSIASNIIASSIGNEVWNKYNIDDDLIYAIAINILGMDL